jgi:hypothetical protein
MKITQKDFPRRFKFSNKLLLDAVKAGLRGCELSDASYGSFTAWISTDESPKISFRHRPRINGERVTFNLADFNPDLDPATGEAVFGVTEAHAAAGRAKADYLNKVTTGRVTETKPRKAPTLLAFIGEEGAVGIYEADRVAGKVKTRGKKGEAARQLPMQWHQNKRDMRRVYKPLLNTPVNELTRDEVTATENAFLDAVEAKRGHRPESVRNIARTYLLQILDHAARSRYMTAEEFLGETAEQSDERDRYLLPGEWQRIAAALNALDERHPLTGLFLRFALYQGVRITMVARMRWDQLHVQPFTVDGETTEILVWSYKGGRGSGMKKAQNMVVPVVGAAREIYDQLAALCPDEASRKRQPTVFPPHVSQRWTRNSHQWAPDLHAASLTAEWTRHDLRRTHASYKEALHIPKEEISIALGHNRKKKKGAERHNSTHVYTKGPADFVRLAHGYERLHKLLRDIEHGRLTQELETIQQNLPIDEITDQFINEFNLDRADTRIIVRTDLRKATRAVPVAA